ncbi:hypothetical protein FA95DRAFT_1614316 [Auriscalpium vulgare]|uniref:Uncharacterized protein n=1 Tax=Auriscalpium vulgare TaxID=40419 RepID=A0ACB8R0B1_9AGAM|nr:hypothetical protein FA95DRAFT_1614316 [Auriscalpium vulgare]
MRGPTFFTALAALLLPFSSQKLTVHGLPVAGQVEAYVNRELPGRLDSGCWLKRCVDN